jgi:hypothetical protein
MKYSRLALAVVLVATALGALAWYYRPFGRDATIPLIDRNDPAHADTLALLDRRVVFAVTGEANHPIEKLPADRLRVVQQIARARLSQAVYEAGLARVENRGDREVIITIPAYRWAGRKLERQVMRELGPGADDAQRQRLRVFFMHFGDAQQVLTVRRQREEIEGRPLVVYSILHQLERWTSTTTLGSTLPATHLVTYAPFLLLFPKEWPIER